ncbi:glutamate-1-semialdehyde 2,1-aminomutase [Glaciihabitans tibetensis]|uniref:Glutamate-1-semialdehyde 2,1-aminomutase n=1 Tax=Glaciihabitans tibetensis TaxID=1266600 RepID=A0A2T0VAT9_9MICO|nr:aminotransferase class III-fold pyridoxal phosphate-dependent enzyme [Glaciihabitans tibetensis]PRY67273.1 glutamate-1-semialdehyde 2,1-aminomutase [Glaciihabitans tibetensis]
MTLLTTPRLRTADSALRDRALAVVPGGVYGHMTVLQQMPPSYPQFYSRGAGARVWDVDDNEYIDFMCAFGPMIAGYANPVIDAAAAAQQVKGDALAGPSRHFVELAELLVDTVAHADWAMFAKNGTDATSIAVVTARAETGRTKLLKARKAYHGANAWFTPNPAGVTAADRADIIEFEYNDLASLEAAVAEAEGDVAAIIVPPFRHDALYDQELATAEFARGVRAIATRIGAAFILDEVRTGFRLDMAGAWEQFGVRPDMTAFSKGIANGYSLAAVVGGQAYKEAAASIYVTGSFWMGGVAMAAAVATLTLLRDTNGIRTMNAAGSAFRTGLQSQAAAHGFGLVQTGPVVMPFMRFDDDAELRQVFAFTDAAVRRGVLLHPWHNMFFSAAHTLDDVATALERTDEAFAETRSLFPL